MPSSKLVEPVFSFETSFLGNEFIMIVLMPEATVILQCSCGDQDVDGRVDFLLWANENGGRFLTYRYS